MHTNKDIMTLDQAGLSLYLNGFGVLELRRLAMNRSDDLIDSMNYYYNREKFPQFIYRHLTAVTLIEINRWQRELDEQVRQIQVEVKSRV
ncbi:hypothetical protein [Latilactobacillus graminis]|nr:hypothetical protein [Latilactobacillus graminis]QFP79429.1 hypothetical protein LG542_03935 [Latilactobacillus graminis]